MSRPNSGFTIAELLVVMGISAAIFTVGGISWTRLQKVSQLDELSGGLKTAIYQVQAQSKNNQPAGIFFETNRYVVFKGDQFIENKPGNLETNLPVGITFTQINIPNGGMLSFDHITGYPNSIIGGENVILTDENSQQFRTINLNKAGLVEISQ